MPHNAEMHLESRKTRLLTVVNNSKPSSLVVAVLQKCPDLLKDQCCSCTEACPTSSDDKNQVPRLKVTDLTHAREEDPLQIICPAVKQEHEVNCAFIILVDMGHIFRVV
jgi:hypothetical protein